MGQARSCAPVTLLKVDADRDNLADKVGAAACVTQTESRQRVSGQQ